MTQLQPRREPFVFEASSEIALEPSLWARRIGWVVVLTTVVLYVVFW